MRIFKRILCIAAALAFFAVCNAAISFVYEPYGSNSQVSWSEYSKMESIDTIVVGTSLSQHGLDPDAMDEMAGTNSYNLSTPAQAIEDSFAAIQTAYEDHCIKRAIVAVSQTALTTTGAPNPGSAFLHIRSQYVSPAQTFSVLNQVLWKYGGAGTEGSINLLFPWVGNHIRPSLLTISQTIEAKLAQPDLIEACESYDPGWKYIDRGHGGHSNVVNYNTCSLYLDEDGEEGDEGGEEASGTTVIDADRANTVRDMCAYCEERGIELIMVSIPEPVFNIIDDEKHYFDFKAEVDALCSELGIPHYDFNLANPKHFVVDQEYFHDGEHMNVQGARAFSKALGTMLASRDSGADISDWFITEDELRESVEYISVVVLEDDVDADGVNLHARAVTGPRVNVEYQFFVREGDDWKLVCDWSTDPDFRYTPDRHGSVRFRVNARQVGTDVEYERFRVISDLY